MPLTDQSDLGAPVWPDPTPLVRPAAPAQEYPADALGPILAPATVAIADYTQVPNAMSASSVLAAAALAAQPHADTETLADAKPISIYALTIAGSGERKTTADRRALSPVYKYVDELTKAHRRPRTPEQSAADADTPSRGPWVLCTDPTPEGLVISFRDGQLSQGLFSDESGTLIGGHAFSQDIQLRTAALLSRLWDGSRLDRVRAKFAEHTILYGRRLSLHLMAQPDVAGRLIGNPLYKNQGLLARVLITHPASLVGTRLSDGEPRDITGNSAFKSYAKCMTQLLELQPTVDPLLDGLKPRVLPLSREARERLVKFYNWVERSQASGKQFEFHREWASKAAEHACRIAAVLTLVENPAGRQIEVPVMSNAVKLATYYLREYVRLAGSARVSDEIRDAQDLLEFIKSKKLSPFNRTWLMQYGPNRLRSADLVSTALNVLTEYHWVRPRGSSSYRVHPSLFEEPSP